MSERQVLANQARVLRNQLRLLSNQGKLDQVLKNQKEIKANQRSILGNQRTLDLDAALFNQVADVISVAGVTYSSEPVRGNVFSLFKVSK